MATILIIDDSWLTRRGVKRILSSQGYIVNEAENGLQGMKLILAKEIPVDAIILDLLMPEMSGTEFLEKLNENNIKIPVIVLTADIQHTVKSKCIELGAKGFINKPPDPEHLLNIVSSLF
ncbi:MAG: response regulator [Desulfamplus sp.]|nr:response regulator [Desulfamplus sp.]MBF0414023.1 response regulator [Desulfamplus sp.]